MGSVTRKKIMSIMALGAMIGLLLLPVLVMSMPCTGCQRQRRADAREEERW